MASLTHLGKRIAPWRFLMFFALLAVGIAIAVGPMGWSKGVLAGFDVAAFAFLASCIPTFRYDVKRMRQVAKDNDANRLVLLGLSFLITVVIMAAVIDELGQAGKLSPWDKGLVAASLAVVWLFVNMVYTLHYTHLFYTADDGGKDCGGLLFPGTKNPVMSDFVYFAYTLGVAVQTSDVEVTNKHFRMVVTAHCVAGFFFNLGVLALTINVLGSS